VSGPDETPEQAMKRLRFEEHCADIGRSIGDVMPPNVGFAFLMFDFGEGGNMAWISSGQREHMIKVLEELLAKLRGGNGKRSRVAADIARGARNRS
jgi:hypothetical protein